MQKEVLCLLLFTVYHMLRALDGCQFISKSPRQGLRITLLEGKEDSHQRPLHLVCKKAGFQQKSGISRDFTTHGRFFW